MNPANHINEEDLALFALHILPEDEVKAVVSHLEHCESCRTQVGMMQGDLVSYAMTAEMHTPPAAVRERLLRRIGKEKKFVPQQVSNEPVLSARQNSRLFDTSGEEIVVERRMGVAGWAGWAIAAGIAACRLGDVGFEHQLASGGVCGGDRSSQRAALHAFAGDRAFAPGLELVSKR